MRSIRWGCFMGDFLPCFCLAGLGLYFFYTNIFSQSHAHSKLLFRSVGNFQKIAFLSLNDASGTVKNLAAGLFEGK